MADYEASSINNSIGIWFHDDSLFIDIRRLMQIKLNQTFKFTRTFTDKEHFITYLESKLMVPIIFISSGKWSENLCRLVKNRSENYRVYELDLNLTQSIRRSSNTWITFSNIEELFKNISADFITNGVPIDGSIQIPDDEEYTYKKISPPLGIFTLSLIPKSFHFVNKESLTFLLLQVLNKIITRMTYDENDLKNMWYFCRQKYENNPAQMNDINKFKEKYCSSSPVRLYTENSFLFRSLNEVLRREDTDGIYQFRCYIADLHKQLASISDEQNATASEDEIILYRGKKLPLIVLQQLKELENEKDKHISMNGFLSTTKDERTANKVYGGADEKRDGYESVLFKLHIDRTARTTIPYADIRHISNFPEENEFLFSTGSVWQLRSIERSDDAVWTIVLILSNTFHIQFNEFLRQIFDNDPFLHGQSPDYYHILLIADILRELGKYSQAEEFYYRLLENNLPDEFKRLIHFELATIKGEQGQYTEAQRHFKEIIDLNESNTVSINTRSLASSRPIHANMKMPSEMLILNNLALVYQKKHDHENARNSFKRALEKQGSITEKTRVHQNLGNLENYCGNLREAHEHFQKAIELTKDYAWVKELKEDLARIKSQLDGMNCNTTIEQRHYSSRQNRKNNA